ncbi:MAG TPA: hypothetical protein VK524_34520 [Polyangiaceae bacterium]|nr:hypothetical protein [Polyangiaceae bacterium]
MSDATRKLTFEQAREAIAVKGDGDDRRVHCFLNPGVGVLIGADWDEGQVLDAFREHGAEVAGDAAMKMRHGVAVRARDGAWFFATRDDWTPP